MDKQLVSWEFLNTENPKNIKDIIEILLKNRGLNSKKLREEFISPIHPGELSLRELGIEEKEVGKSVERIKKAIEEDEQIIIYGDYDADGVCSSAILWECLYNFTKKVTPFLPDRFIDGYGINAKSVEKLKKDNPELKLLITVDNGIVADAGVEKAKELGIDVIITDHHQKGEKYPKAFSIIHTDKLSGSGIAWIFAREVGNRLNTTHHTPTTSLELAAIGTIADQLPLLGPNRSIVKYGLEELNRTKRPGLIALFEEAGIIKGEVGTYEVNYLIAPRLNAMGRLKNAMVSLRLLCTSNNSNASEYALELGRTNRERQEIVDKVVLHARETATKNEWKGAIVLADESYHEGVIGLAAGKLVEEFGRPAIVLSKGLETSKASARSISGFNIIENIRKMHSYILGGGGHPMAAGFSIETSKIEAFIAEFDKLTEPLLTNEILQKRIKIDCNVNFKLLTNELFTEIKKIEPTGMGNPSPVFAVNNVNVIESRGVGEGGKHLKLKLAQDRMMFEAIAFNLGYLVPQLSKSRKIDAVFNLDENIWNGVRTLQFKIKDVRILK